MPPVGRDKKIDWKYVLEWVIAFLIVGGIAVIIITSQSRQ